MILFCSLNRIFEKNSNILALAVKNIEVNFIFLARLIVYLQKKEVTMNTADKYLRETADYSAEDAKFMAMAIDLSIKNIDEGGGPFGAVIVRNGEVIPT